MPKDSKIYSQLKVDPALQQNANYKFNADERQYIDKQILGIEQHLVDSLISGAHQTWFRLSSGSPSVVAGDVVCLSSETSSDGIPLVTKALPVPLGVAKSISGVVTAAAGPGSRVHVAISGTVPPSLTGLSTGAGLIRVSTTARCELVSQYATSDYPVGTADSAGNLTIHSQVPISSFNIGSLSTTPYTLDSGSAAVVAGDLVCSANNAGNDKLVTKATPSALASAGVVLGIATASASPGATVNVGVDGTAPNSITGLGAGAAGMIIANSSARCARAPYPHGGEFVVGVCDQRGNVTITPRASVATSPVHVFNIKAYGAAGDGVTDDSNAFYACQEAIRQTYPTGFRGAVMYFPPGTYYFARDIEITTPSLYTGAGAGGQNQLTRIRLAPRVSWRIVYHISGQYALGYGGDARIENFEFIPDGVFVPKWQPNHAYAVGDIVRLSNYSYAQTTGPGGDMRLVYYYECLVAGTSGATETDFCNTGPTLKAPYAATQWTASKQYKYGSVVRSSDPTKWGYQFSAVTPGFGAWYRSSGTEPTWDFTPGNYTNESGPDGLIQWKCTASSGSVAQEAGAGTPVWVCRTSPCIYMSVPSKIEHCSFSSATDVWGNWMGGVAIHCYGNQTNTPFSSVNALTINDCFGSGFDVFCAIGGADAQGGRIIGCGSTPSPSVRQSAWAGDLHTDPNYPTTNAPPRYAFFDYSYGGNTYVGCYDEGHTPGKCMAGPSAVNTVLGGYSENTCTPNVYQGVSIALGGNGGNDPFTGNWPIPPANGGPSLQFNGCYNIREYMPAGQRGPKTQSAWLGRYDTYQYFYTATLDAADDAGAYWGWASDWNQGTFGKGYYAKIHSQLQYQPIEVDLLIQSGSPAKKWFPHGHFEGRTGTGAPARYWFPDQTAWEDPNIRGGLRKVGDIRIYTTSAVAGGYVAKVVTADGYEGPQWGVGKSLAWPTGLSYATPANIVAPSNSAPLAQQAKRFRVQSITGSNIISGAEPDWSTATTIGVSTVTNGTDGITYLYIGSGCTTADFGKIVDTTQDVVTQSLTKWNSGTSADSTALAEVDSKRDAVTTSNNTPTTIGTFSIPTGCAFEITATITGWQPGGPNMYRSVWRCSGYRSGSSNAVADEAAAIQRSSATAGAATWASNMSMGTTSVTITGTGDNSGNAVHWNVLWQAEITT